VSIGVAALVPDKNNDYSSVLEDADKVMYESKAAGRNRVSVAKKPDAVDSQDVPDMVTAS